MDRNQCLNFLKGLGSTGVVFIHITFPGLTGEIISKMAQFAVPVFFMITGYYALGCIYQFVQHDGFIAIR